MEGLYLKRATAEDIHGIMEVTRDAFTRYAQMAGLDTVEALNEDYEKVKQDIQNKYVYAAYLDGRVVGSLRIEADAEKGTAYLSRFGVSTLHQNLGVGKKLIKLVDSEMPAMGVKRLCLHTSSRVSPLIIFYYSVGFYIQSVSHDRGYPRALLVKEY